MMRASQSPGLLCAAALALTSFGVANAEPAQASALEPYRLTWTRERGAESCISGAALSRLLEQVVGSAATTSGAPRVLDGRVEPAEAPLRWRVRVRVSDVRGELFGERELTSAEAACSGLTSSVLLIMAMSIDPDAAREGLPSEVVEELRRNHAEDVDVWPAPPAQPGLSQGKESAPSAASASSKPSASTAVHSTAARSLRVDPRGTRGLPAPIPFWQLLSAVALSTRLLPQLAPGLALGLRWVLPPGWALAAEGSAWLPNEVPLAGAHALADGVSFGAAQVVTVACRSLGTDMPFSVMGCGGATLGLRWVSADALATQNDPRRLYFAPVLSAEANWRAGKGWFLRGGASASASLRRDRFTYRDSVGQTQVLFEPKVLSGYTFLGLGARL